MLINILNWLLGITQSLGYWGVGLLMAVESSFIPFPSEIVIPPAAYLASQHQLNLGLVILAGVGGSLIGATLNYFLARSLGRHFIYRLANHRLANYLGISVDKIARAEIYFLKNAHTATFWGRLIPVIRQLISLPAGFSRMPFGRFIWLTTLGATIWTTILAVLGYFLGANQALLHLYYQEISWGLLGLALLWLTWKIIKYRRQPRSLN